MKKYIILTPSIVNMGGAQMYVLNKANWLEKNGWTVDVISSQDGNIILTNLKKYNQFISEFNFYCYLFSQEKRKSIINKVITNTKALDYDNIIIESTCISQSTWGEILAQSLKAKHISYLLQESNPVEGRILQDFFVFKHKRRELVSITENSLLDMFKSFYPIKSSESYMLPAWCNNVEADVDCPFIDTVAWDAYDYRVGFFSRLDKPFVESSLEDFASFARKNREKSILLVIIGASPDGKTIENKILNFYKSYSNVRLIITGYLYPVPTRLLESFDVLITSAGCCVVSARSGVPTISIDANDYKAIGIYGRSTNNTVFRNQNEPPIACADLLDEVLVNQKYKKLESSFRNNIPIFTDHINFANDSAKNIKYYSFDNVELSVSEKRIKIGLSMLGSRNYSQFMKMFRNLFRL